MLKSYVQGILNASYTRTYRGHYLTEFSKNMLPELISTFKNLGHHVRMEDSLKKRSQKASLSKDKVVAVENYKAYLLGLRLSESSIRSYASFVASFLIFIKDKPLVDLDNDDVRLFVEMIVPKKNYAISSHRQMISALKHFAFFYPACGINAEALPRPTKSRKLPLVLSQEQVIDLLRSTRNLKHRAVLGLIYSSGLRIGELLNLELKDIEIDRKQLFIRNGKGRKDRYIVLAESFVPLLRNYIVTYRPQRYFVEGLKGGKYSASSIRKFLKQSCEFANIHKSITPHTLRHSYATHLLENGIGIRHIQELLGHAKPETTMIYTHVAKKDLLDIRSPLDTIMLSLSKTDKPEQNFLLSRSINL
jgi:site-specific recombinase XerD